MLFVALGIICTRLLRIMCVSTRTKNVQNVSELILGQVESSKFPKRFAFAGSEP